MNLLGGVALLLWGTGMVQTGITRAYGAGLRMWIGKGMSNPAKSLVAGVGVSVLLQSSTATAILMASFASRGIVETAPALAVLLGGDIGTTLVVQAMTFRLNWIAPFFLLVGVVLYRNSTVLERQELGRALTGLGLMLFALGHIVSTSQPLRDSGVLPLLLPSLGGDSMILVVIGALLAWLAHSSLAMVLLIISLTSSGVLPLSMAFVLVLGVNIGGVLPA
ncbi:MAG: Na/Pi symporter, partial [Deltaproteobacteria bacterium]|nr:Na/Pi symporter [Deltaproteobacteria bacterium]